jgi:hypothetical protein
MHFAPWQPTDEAGEDEFQNKMGDYDSLPDF